MKIMVFVRQVLSAGELVEIDTANKRVDDSRAKFQPHPTDEAAVEEAVRLKESGVDATVTVVCVGPERMDVDLKAFLAVGADEAIRVWDTSLEGARLGDCAVAGLLAEVARKLSPQWIICGDDPATLLAGFLSELLALPAVTSVRGMEPADPGLKLRRKLEKSTATVAMSAPGILAVERGHTPRYPSHRDRLLAQRKTISLLGAAEMPEAIQAIADSTAKLEIEAVTLPKPGKKNYPPSEDGFSRYVGLLLGGMAGGDTGGQVVEDSAEKMADAALTMIESLGVL